MNPIKDAAKVNHSSSNQIQNNLLTTGKQ
uniref:Uncharacterized protein n=1 Tax=Anguilla anguilla TaxID=7936 RepID=A0A0E9VB80_ANGAN